MNDYREIRHGHDCLLRLVHTPTWQRFAKVVGKADDEAGRKLGEGINNWAHSLFLNTYVTCLSEHLAEEDFDGRLSMWRAYGSQASVALVLDPQVFAPDSSALSVYSSPVRYMEDSQYKREFVSLTARLEKHADFLNSCPPHFIDNAITELLAETMLFTKHPSFWEEREWRVYYAPWREQSARLEGEVRAIGGVPQKIFKIPLESLPDQGLVGLSPGELLERVIIGPTQFGPAMVFAFAEALEKAGVPDAGKKVFLSRTSLRS